MASPPFRQPPGDYITNSASLPQLKPLGRRHHPSIHTLIHPFLISFSLKQHQHQPAATSPPHLIPIPACPELSAPQRHHHHGPSPLLRRRPPRPPNRRHLLVPGPTYNLTLGLDRTLPAKWPCTISRGAHYSVYVTYTDAAANGTVIHYAAARSNPAVLADGWTGLLPFVFNIPYGRIQPDSEVEITLDWVPHKKGMRRGTRSHTFFYKAAATDRPNGRGEVNAATTASEEGVVAVEDRHRENAYLICQL
ncbi:hypothetical protein PG997_013647 [Apiospora hydei]|uniref:Uncharacterized protein n=1 Tax=Apiospora hydei TaxID=1337664 RepID=A0ABR1V6V8_9PEZI